MDSLDAAWVAADFAEAETAPLSSEDLRELSRYLVPKYLQRGEVLFHVGEHPAGGWTLQSGAIEQICRLPGTFALDPAKSVPEPFPA